ncbi:hypothetical protein F5883DRAFT_644949 [Diaporthe sp. PMI_573]|nr:hypothetical protein F5883DRAFT_644949 [Diaporthaceae sp. PMI_573]
MCYEEVADILCHKQDCDAIISNNAHVEFVLCEIAEDNGGDFGWCGHKGKKRVDTRRAVKRKHICDGCRAKAVERQKRIYANIGPRVANNREAEGARDVERRERAEEQRRQEEAHSAIWAEEQAALVPGARTEWPAAPGGFSHGTSGMYDYPEMGVERFLQEVEWKVDMDETADQGWNDASGGSGHGYDGRYTHGGDQGYRQ